MIFLLKNTNVFLSVKKRAQGGSNGGRMQFAVMVLRHRFPLLKSAYNQLAPNACLAVTREVAKKFELAGLIENNCPLNDLAGFCLQAKSRSTNLC